MRFTIIKCNKPYNAIGFSNEFKIHSGSYIPFDYFMENESYLFFDDGNLIGGYAIIKKNKRVISQIPLSSFSTDIYDIDKKSYEITGYFITKQRKPFKMVCHFMYKVLTAKTKWFVYAYDKRNIKLEKLYSYGKPRRLYSGIVNNIDGMTGVNYENVEMITKIGFIRLWINLIYRKYLKVLYIKRK